MLWDLFVGKVGIPVEEMTVAERQSASQAIRRFAACLSPATDVGIDFIKLEYRASLERFKMWTNRERQFKAISAFNELFKETFESWIHLTTLFQASAQSDLAAFIEQTKTEQDEAAIRQEALNQANDRIEQERLERARLAEEAKAFNS